MIKYLLASLLLAVLLLSGCSNPLQPTPSHSVVSVSYSVRVDPGVIAEVMITGINPFKVDCSLSGVSCTWNGAVGTSLDQIPSIRLQPDHGCAEWSMLIGKTRTSGAACTF